MTSQSPSKIEKARPTLPSEPLNEDVSALFASTALSMVQIDLDLTIRKADLVDDMQVGFTAEDAVGRSLAEIENEDGAAVRYFEMVRDSGKPKQQVRAFRPGGPNGQLRTFNTLWYPVFGSDGAICAVGAITEDISDIEQRESALKHIARELQHRVKNTLANVIALVEQAERSSAGREDALKILKRRVIALAATHSRLTEANWGPTPLRAILEQEMTQIYGAESIRLDGPNLLMTAQSALAFSMGLHEMMANAANYGGLSEAGGKVSLDWRIEPAGDDGGWIHFDWKESGGPDIVQEASASGFGHRLIDASLRTSLRGKMERIWEDDGLRYRFSLPLALISGS